MPNYTKHNKNLFPLTEENFKEGMDTGHFTQDRHRALAALLFYSGVRITEVLRARKEQFKITEDRIYFDVGQRLKRGLVTPPLPILKDHFYVSEICQAVEDTRPGAKVFPYCRATGYNIIDRAFKTYPHHFRLTKITMLLRKGFTIDLVRSWTGHKQIGSLNAYVGFGNLEKLAEV